ncbi:MAG: hypothetical protein R2719_05590 [Micropruina sp.]
MTWRQRLSRWDVRSAPYLYIAPFFVLFAVVGLFPLLYTGWVALNRWSLITGNQGFIGLGISATCSPSRGSPTRWSTRSASSCCRRCRRSSWRS